MGILEHRGSQRAKPCSIFLHSAPQSSEESPWVGNKTGHSPLRPAVTGRDSGQGDNVLLSGKIGKRVVTGDTGSWRSLIVYNRK